MTGWESFFVNGLLALAVLVVLVGGLCNRQKQNKGIGWQFIRYTVLASALPIVALLGLNSALSSEAATLIGTCVGFAFGKMGEKDA